MIEDDKRGDQYQRKGQFLPHVEGCTRGVLDEGLVLHEHLLPAIQGSIGYGRHHQHLYPQAEVGRCWHKELPATDVSTQQEEARRLAETSHADGPKQAGLLSQRDVAKHKVPHLGGLGIVGYLIVQRPYAQVGQLISRIKLPGKVVEPLYRLQQQQRRGQENGLVAPVTGKEQHQAHDDKQQQHIACGKESGIEGRETHQQQHTPQKAVAKIVTLKLLMAGLYIKGKAKQQGKDGISLAREEAEHPAHHRLVDDFEPGRRMGGIDREDEMFQIVYQDDGHHGKAP